MTGEMTTLKLYIDEDIWAGLAAELRQRGYDAINVYEADREELENEEQLEYAVSEGRAILSFNKKHYLPLATAFFYACKPHCGIIVSKQLPCGELLRRVENLLKTLSADQIKNTVQFLEQFR